MNPKVGIGVIVKKDDKVLLGKRINSLGHNTWAFPGGALNYRETPEKCAEREVLEETNIKIKNIRRGPFTNDFHEDEHYITLFMLADYDSGKLKLMEPDKCEKWQWFSWDELPEPRFLPLKNLLEQGFKI